MAIPSLTLDTNCIVAVAEGRPQATAVVDMAAAHRAGTADVALVAISASERQLGNRKLENFIAFKERVGDLGLGHLRLLEPMFYFDITFWDYCIWSSDEMEQLEQRIHEVLFQTIPFKWLDRAAQLGIDPNAGGVDWKWLNAKCDVQAFWAHTYHQRDVFVTSDANFHASSKREALIAIAGGRIERPESATEWLATA